MHAILGESVDGAKEEAGDADFPFKPKKATVKASKRKKQTEIKTEGKQRGQRRSTQTTTALRLNPDNPYLKCDYCSYESSQSHAFYSHMKIHFDGPPYKCPDCDYEKKSIRDVMLHRLKHSKERRFTCETCGQKFKFPTGLSNHMLFIHSGTSKL